MTQQPFSLKTAAQTPQPPAFTPPVVSDLFGHINEIDASKELAIQFSLAKSTFSSAQNDSTIPVNQKAQLLNTCASILSSIVKTQESVYNLERMKVLEDTLITTLQSFPDIKEAFLTAYETALEALNAKVST